MWQTVIIIYSKGIINFKCNCNCKRTLKSFIKFSIQKYFLFYFNYYSMNTKCVEHVIGIIFSLTWVLHVVEYNLCAIIATTTIDWIKRCQSAFEFVKFTYALFSASIFIF